MFKPSTQPFLLFTFQRIGNCIIVGSEIQVVRKAVSIVIKVGTATQPASGVNLTYSQNTIICPMA